MDHAAEYTEDISQLTSPQLRAEAEESWSDPGVKPALIANIAGGLLYGVSIGMIPVLFQFNQYLGDCSRYTSQDACDALTYTACKWITYTSNSSSSTNTTVGMCAFPDHATVDCSSWGSQESCSNAHGGDSCYWRYHKEVCAHLVGWTSTEQGLLAGIQIIGAMIAAAISGPMANKIGRKKSLAVNGLVAAVACFFFSVGWAVKESFAMLMIGELLIGFASGSVSVVCPMYCGEMVPGPKMQQAVGVIFQLLVTAGIAVMGAIGLGLDPKDDTSTPSAHLQGRFQWLIAVQWITAIYMFPLAYFTPESTLWLAQERKRDQKRDAAVAFLTSTKEGSTTNDDKSAPLKNGDFLGGAKEHTPLTNKNESSLSERSMTKFGSDGNSSDPGDKEKLLVREGRENDGEAEEDGEESSNLRDLFTRENTIPLLVGMTLGIAQQFSGINSIMLYAPSMASKLGMTPLLGNFLVGLWNFLTCFIPMPLVQRFSCRQIFIVTIGVATFADFLTGISVFPGVFPDNSGSQHGLGIFGILLFIAAFEAGIGPCFYVLAQDVFPKKVRALGTSYTVYMCFFMNVWVNFLYPVLATSLSGGPSGNQNKGMGIMFFIFGSFALLCTMFLYFFQPKSNSELAKEAYDTAKKNGTVSSFENRKSNTIEVVQAAS